MSSLTHVKCFSGDGPLHLYFIEEDTALPGDLRLYLFGWSLVLSCQIEESDRGISSGLSSVLMWS